MNFDITHEGRTTVAVDFSGAIAMGYPFSVVGAALKASAVRATEQVADDYRQRISTSSAGKFAAYRVKEEHAGDASDAHVRALATTASLDPDEVVAAEEALIAREAAARGVDVATLTREHAARALATRRIALLIEAIEAEAKMAIAAIPDDADDIEAQVSTALAVSAAEAASAFSEAEALMGGE